MRRLPYVAALILVLLLIPLRVSGSLRSFAFKTIRPVARPLTAVNRNLVDTWLSLQQIPSLLEQRHALQDQVVSLQRQLLQAEQLTSENSVLRQELGVTGVSRQSVKVLTHVVVQGNDPADSTLVIDVGTDQGVATGQAATYQGALIGRVIQAGRNTSTVRLITSSRSLIQARIAFGQQKGLLSGMGNGLQLTDVQQGASPELSSPVETSGLGGGLPAGILIGTLGRTLSKPSNPTQSFQISLPYDPATLTAFFILISTTS